MATSKGSILSKQKGTKSASASFQVEDTKKERGELTLSEFESETTFVELVLLDFSPHEVVYIPSNVALPSSRLISSLL